MDFKKVLIVEDDEDLAQVIEVYFQEMKPAWQIAKAHHATPAIELAEDYRPDILITDLRLGKDSLSGLELAAKLRERFPSMFVAIITGAIIETEEQKDLHHANVILVKPLDLSRLISKIPR